MGFILLIFCNISYTQQHLSQQTQNISLSTKDITLQQDEIEKTIEDIKREILQIDDTKKEKILKILKETKDNIRLLKDEEYIKEPQQALLELRKAILSYYLKTNKYPSVLEELVPEFIPYIPKIEINSESASSVKYIRTSRFDTDYAKAVDSSSQYIYFSDPKSIYWGFLIINSTHQLNGIPLWKY